MAAEDLVEAIHALTPDERETVRQFIAFLRAREGSPESPFLAAAGEFIEQHPELLRRLAQ